MAQIGAPTIEGRTWRDYIRKLTLQSEARRAPDWGKTNGSLSYLVVTDFGETGTGWRQLTKDRELNFFSIFGPDFAKPICTVGYCLP